MLLLFVAIVLTCWLVFTSASGYLLHLSSIVLLAILKHFCNDSRILHPWESLYKPSECYFPSYLVYVRNFWWTPGRVVAALLQLVGIQMNKQNLSEFKETFKVTKPSHNVFKTTGQIFPQIKVLGVFRQITDEAGYNQVQCRIEWVYFIRKHQNSLCSNALDGFLLCLQSDPVNQSVKVRHHRRRVTSDQSFEVSQSSASTSIGHVNTASNDRPLGSEWFQSSPRSSNVGTLPSLSPPNGHLADYGCGSRSLTRIDIGSVETLVELGEGVQQRG